MPFLLLTVYRKGMLWFRPNGLGVILFVPMLVLAQFLPALWPQGILLLILVLGEAATSHILFWLQLILPYFVAMPLGRLLVTRIRVLQRFAPVLTGRQGLLVICATATVALPAALIVSKYYWGYYFRRPPVDHRVAQARRVHALTFVLTEQTANGELRMVPDANFSLAAAIDRGRTDPYDTPQYRALVLLADKGLLSPVPPSPTAETVRSAYGSLEATGLLVSGEAGYPNAKRLTGVLMEFETETGEALTFLAVHSGEVSNDHYAAYEAVFSIPSGGGRQRLLSSVRFFYDIAGIEGVEWWIIWIVFTLLGSMLAVPGTIIVQAFRPASVRR